MTIAQAQDVYCSPSHRPQLAQVGARRPWNYYLQASYWWPRPTDTSTALQQLLADEAEVRGTHTLARIEPTCLTFGVGPDFQVCIVDNRDLLMTC